MDVSGWVRHRLRDRLTSPDHAFSCVVTDGITARLAHEDRAIALLGRVLDLALGCGPTSSAVLLEIERTSLPEDEPIALRITRAGDAIDQQRVREEIAALSLDAQRIGGELSVDEVSDTVLSLTLILDLR